MLRKPNDHDKKMSRNPFVIVFVSRPFRQACLKALEMLSKTRWFFLSLSDSAGQEYELRVVKSPVGIHIGYHAVIF